MSKVKTWMHRVLWTGGVVLSPVVFADYNQDANGYSSQYQSYQMGQNSGNQPLTPEEQAQVNEAAFKELLKQYFPLTSDQLHQFKDASAEQKKANATPPGPAPNVETSNIIPVDFKPGHVMPVIRIAAGSVSSIVFTDKAGKIWPIVSYTIGDPEAFGIQWKKSSGVLMVQGKKLYGQSNIGVMLQGMDIPVMITILLGQTNWDYLDYVQVQQYLSSDSGGVQPSSVTPAPPYLISVLNGVPPAGAVELTVAGGNAKVWNYLGKYLMLTQSTLLSPSWSFRADAPSGYHAYELQPAPYLMISTMGQIQKITVSSPDNGGSNSDVSSGLNATQPASAVSGSI
jgi:intracellular multiplication protein IcmK